MRALLCLLVLLVLALQSGVVTAEPPTIEESVLENRLNNLESRTIQRQQQEQKTLDLLKRQDDKIAGQALDGLKTRRPLGDNIPRLERKLDRSRRIIGRPGYE